jgi:multiple sugar transport system permease protein
MTTASPERRSWLRRHDVKENLAGWLFASPWVILFLVFMAGPILAALALSFTDFGLADLQDPLSAEVIGVDNYTALFSDGEFRKASWNTFVFTAVAVPLVLGIALALAVLIDRGIKRFKTFFRVGYYLPEVTAIVAIAILWRFMFHPDLGLLNTMLSWIGIDGPNWLGNPSTAMPAVITVAVWRHLGANIVILLAGLQAIDPVMYEAARVDGAGGWQLFRNITLPLVRPTLLFATVITSIGYLQVFEEPFLMTQGGPLNATQTVAMMVYEQGFAFFNMGYASAIAYLLFLVIAGLATVQFRMLRPET